MNGLKRTILGTSMLAFALALAGCESFDPPELFNTKKPLPGERRAVFPEGVPGAPRGIPPEMIKGNQTAEATASVPENADAKAGAKSEGAEPAKAEEKPKPKPKPKVVAKPPAPAPKQASAEAKPANDDVWPPPPKSNAPAQQTAAPWPAPTNNKPAAAWPSQ
jgi:hypothetical protein